MYSTVIGAKQIAITLNNEGLSTQKGHKWTNIRILDILANPVYTGTLVWGKTTRDYDGKTINSDPENIIRIENAHPAIIDSDTFERIQARLATFNPMNKTRIIQPRALNSNYLLSGFLRCQCGSPLSGTQAKSGKYAYYSCVKQCKMGKTQCEMRPIPQHHLENIVINYLKIGLLTEDNISLLLKNHKDKHESGSNKLKEKLKKVGHELVLARKNHEKILDYIEAEGKFAEFGTGQRLRERKLQIINLELEQSQLKAAIVNPPSYEISAVDIRKYIIHCERILNEATVGEKKELLRSIIQGITLNWNGKEWEGILKYSFPASDVTGTGNKVPGSAIYGSP